MVAELDRTGADQISLTDPDARAMARDMLPRIHVIGKLARQRRHAVIQASEDALAGEGSEWWTAVNYSVINRLWPEIATNRSS